MTFEEHLKLNINVYNLAETRQLIFYSWKEEILFMNNYAQEILQIKWRPGITISEILGNKNEKMTIKVREELIALYQGKKSMTIFTISDTEKSPAEIVLCFEMLKFDDRTVLRAFGDLRKWEAVYQDMLDSMPFPVALFDKNNKFVYENKLFNKDRFEIIKRTCLKSAGHPLFENSYATLQNMEIICEWIINDEAVGQILEKKLRGDFTMVIRFGISIDHLTKREKEVLGGILQKKPYSQIAKDLDVDIRTIYTLARRIIKKFSGRIHINEI